MLMIVIKMLILVLLNLTTGYADDDVDLCSDLHPCVNKFQYFHVSGFNGIILFDLQLSNWTSRITPIASAPVCVVS